MENAWKDCYLGNVYPPHAGLLHFSSDNLCLAIKLYFPCLILGRK